VSTKLRRIPRSLRARTRRALRRARPAAARWAFRTLGAQPRFVIVSHGRAGSELLVSLLNSHPRIVCDSEILNVRRVLPAEMLLRRSARARLSGRAYGFKLLGHHAKLQNPEAPISYLRAFHDRGFQIILLERRDWLMQAISAMRAAGSQYHYRRGDQVQFAPARLDPTAILAALWLIDQGASFIRTALAELPALSLVYEDDLATESAQARTVDRVCEYLGLPTAPVQTELVKIGPDSAAQQVANFDEVAALLAATPYATFLPAGQP
jgi:LPS sulfotransferase NodH